MGICNTSRFYDGILIRGFTILERKQMFHQELQLVEFMEWWYDDMRNEADRGAKDLFNQGSYWKKPRWPKDKWGMYACI